jgi:N-acetylglucosaminyldiphosphoundecaprenol N-acetyl-beta-D-mannosaminyltransferase
MANDMAMGGPGPASCGPVRTDFRRPVYCLLGVPIDAVDLPGAAQILAGAMASGTRCVMTTPNLNNLVAMRRDPAFRDAVIRNELSVADGMPLVWISRLLGIPLKERVAGSDLFEWLGHRSDRPVGVYFFGGPDGAAEAASLKLNAARGTMHCVGHQSPGFGNVEALSRADMIERINRSNADFLIIAMGTAKGHVWIERNRPLLRTRVISHLGAVINFAGGTLSRAPGVMRRLGLEWLWRIKEEPALWRRYWNDACDFLPLLFTHVAPSVAERMFRAVAGTGAPPRVQAASDGATVRFSLAGSWLAGDLAVLRELFEQELRQPRDVEIDAAALGGIDEAFVGLLMLVYGHQSKLGRGFRIRPAGNAVRRAFRRRCAEFLVDGLPGTGTPPARAGGE